MTRKDYVLLAKVFAANRPSTLLEEGGIDLWEAMREDLANRLARESVLFNRDMFYSATEL